MNVAYLPVTAIATYPFISYQFRRRTAPAKYGGMDSETQTLKLLSRSAGWVSSNAFPRRTENLLRAF